MITVTKVIRATGRVDKSKGLVIPGPLPLDEDTDVDVIIIPGDDDISEEEWLRMSARNPVFADWADPEEDIYSLGKGVPFDESAK